MLFKKNLNEIIVEVEGLALDLGEDISTLYSELYKLTKDKTYKDISEKYKKRQSRVDAYKKYVSKDLLDLIQALETVNQDVPTVLEEYNKYYKVIKTAEEKLENQIRKSIALFVIISLVIYALLNQFNSMVQNFSETLGKMAMGISNNLPIVIKIFKIYVVLYLVITIVFFVFLKRKNPLTRRIYNYLDSIKVLLLLKISLNVGLPPSQILTLLKNSVGIKINKKYVEIIEIIKLLDKYLEGLEKMALSISLKAGIERTVEFINMLLKKKMSKFDEDFQNLKSSIDAYFKITQMLLILFGILGYGAFMMAVMQLVSRITGG